MSNGSTMESPSDHRFWYEATVLRVIDADTVDLDVDLGFSIHSYQRIRLARIDAWETRGVEREKGLIAKARVEELLPVGGQVYVHTEKDKTGKYGRYIADIWVEQAPALAGNTEPCTLNLSDLLVEEGHAEYVTY